MQVGECRSCEWMDGVAARSTKNDSVASRVRQKAEDVRTSTTTSFRKGNRINKAEMMRRCLTTGSPTAVQQLLLYLRTTMAASTERGAGSGGAGSAHAPNKPLLLVLSCCVSGRKEQAGGASALRYEYNCICLHVCVCVLFIVL